MLQEELDSLNATTQRFSENIEYFSDTLAHLSWKTDVLMEEINRLKISEKRTQILLNEMIVSKDDEEIGVYQFVSSLKSGDAIGNYVQFLDETLRTHGVKTQIFCQENLTDRKDVKLLDELGPTSPKDIILFHKAAQDSFSDIADAYLAKKVMIYHNITPDHFFHRYDEAAETSTRIGRYQTVNLRNKVQAVITESQYNKEELQEMGYTVPIFDVALPFSKSVYEGSNDPLVQKKLSDGKKNIIFVGRIAPNKKIEDLIVSYQSYHDHYNANSRLVLIGKFGETDRYYQYLRTLIRANDDIVFSGHVTNTEWITYFRFAHLFLCLSEHEGFCVPLIEAMDHQLPIIAYDTCAVGETLGDGGMLIKDKTPEVVAEKINWIFNNEEYVEELKRKQEKRMQQFDPQKIAEKFIGIINEIKER